MVETKKIKIPGIEESYNLYKKKYELPNFEEIKKNFSIEDIEDDKGILKKIAKIMAEKFEFYGKYLDMHLNAEPTFSMMVEAKEVDDLSREKLLHVYRLILIKLREYYLLVLEENDENCAEYIKNSFNVWISIKQDLKILIHVFKKAWESESKIDERLGYLG